MSMRGEVAASRKSRPGNSGNHGACELVPPSTDRPPPQPDERLELSLLRLIAFSAIGRIAIYAAVFLVIWLSMLGFFYLIFRH
jgi:hypothetical protein